MKLNTTFLLTFFSFAILTACNTDKKAPENAKFEKARQIYNEAMKIHDKVMADMNESSMLITKLKKEQDSLNTTPDSLKLNEIETSISQLQEANKTMFSWMENIQSVPAAEGDKTEIAQRNVVKDTANIIEIQTIQKNEIEELDIQMSNSIEEARKLLEGTK